jgi:hypothetical protein
LRSIKRPRRYIAPHWLFLLKPTLRYSATRDAFVFRVVGSTRGPVLRPDRRGRRGLAFIGQERRGRAIY